MSGIEHKIIITGSAGAGKTTAINCLSSCKVVTTEVHNSDRSIKKENTTVAMDYGEIGLNNGDRLRLYGTPGQQRFDFMWKVLAKGSLGVIILIHNSPRALAELDEYLAVFKEFLQQGRCVIGVSELDQESIPNIDQYNSHLQSQGRRLPVFGVDSRKRQHILLLVETLLCRIEMAGKLAARRMNGH